MRRLRLIGRLRHRRHARAVALARRRFPRIGRGRILVVRVAASLSRITCPSMTPRHRVRPSLSSTAIPPGFSVRRVRFIQVIQEARGTLAPSHSFTISRGKSHVAQTARMVYRLAHREHRAPTPTRPACSQRAAPLCCVLQRRSERRVTGTRIIAAALAQVLSKCSGVRVNQRRPLNSPRRVLTPHAGCSH